MHLFKSLGFYYWVLMHLCLDIYNRLLIYIAWLSAKNGASCGLRQKGGGKDETDFKSGNNRTLSVTIKPKP